MNPFILCFFCYFTDAAFDLPAALEKIKRAREKEAAKQRRQEKKQDKLLFVAFYILLNLAEDSSVERKMVRRGWKA